MKNIKLSQEEKEIFHEIEVGEWESSNEDKKKYQAIAKDTLSKKPVTIRLYKRDINKIKAKAIEEGIPYQTLIGSVIHKYSEDKVQILK